MSSSYASSLSNSSQSQLIKEFAGAPPSTGFIQESVPKASPVVDPNLQAVFANQANGSTDPKNLGLSNQKDLQNAADNLTGTGALAPSAQPEAAWTFITAPEDVSWDISNAANRVDMFGTNNPPVVAGSRGMRDLTLSNSLVEGFVRGVTVEGKIALLEKLMEYGLNSSDGFVSVPVYQVWANNKSYGGSEAYYIIKDVKIKETMRDLKGNTTRAYVDVSLMQVPAYQVNSGRDQASEVSTGAEAALISQAQARAAGRGQGSSAAGAAAGNQGVGRTKPASGPTPGKPPTKPPTDATLPTQEVKYRAVPDANKRTNRPGGKR
jgi:hypothetical protein